MSGEEVGKVPGARLRELCETLQAFAEASTEYPRLLRTIAERMVRVMADGCAVCLFSEGQASLRVVAVHHRDPAITEAARAYTEAGIYVDPEGVSAAVARTGDALVIPAVDAQALASHFRPDIAAFLAKTDVRSILFLPLQVSGVTLGTMVLGRHGPGALAFDDEGADVARTIADSAALAISNARLLDTLQRELEERKRAEAETGRFVALVEHSSDFIAMAGLDGNVLFVNGAGRRMLGIEPNDAVPRLEQFHTAEGMKRAPIIQAQGRWEGEGELRHSRTGVLIPTSVSSFLMRDADGAPMGFATIQRDLREVRRMEQHMRQLQKMEAIGRLAAGVAHDFNNMLSVILSYGSLVMEALPASSTVRAEVEEMVSAGRRASQLTQQLLAFSRQQVLELRVASLNTIVSGMERMARRLLREDIQLTTALDPGIGSIKVDVGQMEQVILNLAVNARDAMPDGGTLTISTGSAVVHDPPAADPSVPAGPYVTLQVSDTGTGMDDATLGRVFEPFFTTKAQGSGTGLGLATVFGVVKQSGGHIAVTSHVGKGTSFTIYLPRHEEPGRVAASEPAAARAARANGGKETILIVEDEAQVRKLMDGILTRAGYKVVSAPNVTAALRSATELEGRIDLLLTDVVMPKMNGPQLAQRFASLRPNAKVLYVSGYMDVQIMALGLEFLRKPFTPDALLERVRQVLDGATVPAGPPLVAGHAP
jgi:two-component system cell cycle sensor histidine kinase/response regulator CckA